MLEINVSSARLLFIKIQNLYKTNVLKPIDFLIVCLYNECRKFGEAECGCHPT